MFIPYLKWKNNLRKDSFLFLDVEVVEEDNDVIGDYLQDKNDDVIHLPGGPDDELDVEYIADKLGLMHNDKGRSCL